MVRIKPIVWSEQRDPIQNKCFYTHVVGECPLGEFSIEWKGWKDNDTDSRAIYLNGEYIECQPTTAGAKDSAESYYRALVMGCIERVEQ